MNGEKPYDFVPFPKETPLPREGRGARQTEPVLTERHAGADPAHSNARACRAGLQRLHQGWQPRVPRRTAGVQAHTRRGHNPPTLLDPRLVHQGRGAQHRGSHHALVHPHYARQAPPLHPAGLRRLYERQRPVHRVSPVRRAGLSGACELRGRRRAEGVAGAAGHAATLDACARRARSTAALLAGQPSEGRKFYRHARPPSGADPRACIKSGAELPLRIHFLNLSEAELGILLTALGLHPDHPFPIKLGGGKPVGLGSVQVILQRITLLQGADALKATGRLGQSQTLVGDALDKFTTRCAQAAADKLIDGDALGELESILGEAGLQETAPADPY
jgi:hypothetical protein